MDELDGPEYNEVQPKKFFVSDKETEKVESDQNHDNTQFKKRFVIESDDDCINDEKIINKKKVKRKRREKRALQISGMILFNLINLIKLQSTYMFVL